MKKKSVILLIGAALLVACTAKKTEYASFDDYPVRTGSLEEMHYSPRATSFAVWSPMADSVILTIYADGQSDEIIGTYPMKRHRDGSWTKRVKSDLNGRFYTFRIVQTNTRFALEETPGIFAKAVAVNGRRGAIIDLTTTNPEGWEADKRPAFAGVQDAIIYEMHHRDMSIDASSGIHHRGKFLALTERGCTSPDGLATGIDHLLELGITHVQILPSYDFGSIDETGAASEAEVLASGAAVGGQYNWGYDPLNYNAPEGSYATNPYDPACRIREMKQMIMALHQAGIRVIMDVVYNHTYDVAHSNFEQTCPGYFYRTTAEGELGNASGCGNETASERAMMRKFMLESVRYWVEEYHIDGFRFDLMGIHDQETMRQIRALLDEIDPTLLLHGEGWTAGTAQLPTDQLSLKANMQALPGIGAFCDDMRDALRGPFMDDHEPAFLDARPGYEESIRFGIAGCISHPEIDMEKVNYSKQAWTISPTQCIAYVSCHDDMMLTDRLRASIPAMTDEEFVRLDKLAQTAVLTSQGVPFIWCGEEVMRDKKGVHNSFCSPDSINAIDWNLKAVHKDVFDYYCRLIAIRKAHPAFHMGTADLVRANLHFPDTEEGVVAFYIIGEAVGDEWKAIFVVLNANRHAVELAMPAYDSFRNALAEEEEVITNQHAVVPAQTAAIYYSL